MKKFFYLVIVLFLSINIVSAKPYEVFVKKNIEEKIVDIKDLYHGTKKHKVFYAGDKIIARYYFYPHVWPVTVSSSVLLVGTNEKIEIGSLADGIRELYYVDGKYINVDYSYSYFYNNDVKKYDLEVKFQILNDDFTINKVIETVESGFTSTEVKNLNINFVKHENDYVFLVELAGLSKDNFKSIIFKTDSDLTNVETVEFNMDNLKKYFPDIALGFEKDIYGKYYAVKDDYLVVSEEKKLSFYNKNELVFEKTFDDDDASSFNKVKIIGNKIIVIKNKKITYLDDLIYSDSLLIYDFNGNLIQTIFENRAILDIDLNVEKEEFVLFTKYTDGICDAGGYDDHLMCTEHFVYDVYGFNLKYDQNGNLVLPGDTDTKPGVDDSGEDKKDDGTSGGEQVNPDTEDVALSILLALLVISLVITIRNKKLEF